MELERLIPNIRPRSNWEASDLGVLMARAWFLPLSVCFIAPLLIVTLVGLTVLHDSPILLFLWVWWFKPLYERLPLHYLSRAIFAEAPSLKTLLRHPLGALGTELLPALTYRRLSLRRSFIAPVYVLERLSGDRAAQRCQSLSIRTESFANWLTILGVHIESALMLGVTIALFLLLPDEWAPAAFEAWITDSSNTWIDWLTNSFAIAAFAAFGPFYIACGFALYLNRRVALEAWDVEIAFRRLAARTQPKNKRQRTASALGIALLMLGIGLTTTPQPAFAADTSSATSSAPAESRQVIEEVMSGPDFHTMDTRRYPKFLQRWLEKALEDADEVPEDSGNILGWIRGLATFFEVLLWACAALLVLWLASKLSGLNLPGLRPRSAPVAAPASVFGIELAEESLPADVNGTARSLWQQGDLRESLSLLLRAALLRMVTVNGCHFSVGDTEQECLQEVRRCAPDTTYSAFSQLMSLWLRVAYAHRKPLNQEFERVCDLLQTIPTDQGAT